MIGQPIRKTLLVTTLFLIALPGRAADHGEAPIFIAMSASSGIARFLATVEWTSSSGSTRSDPTLVTVPPAQHTVSCEPVIIDNTGVELLTAQSTRVDAAVVVPEYQTYADRARFSEVVFSTGSIASNKVPLLYDVGDGPKELVPHVEVGADGQIVVLVRYACDGQIGGNRGISSTLIVTETSDQGRTDRFIRNFMSRRNDMLQSSGID